MDESVHIRHVMPYIRPTILKILNILIYHYIDKTGEGRIKLKMTSQLILIMLVHVLNSDLQEIQSLVNFQYLF